jgi:hypothetical protein
MFRRELTKLSKIAPPGLDDEARLTTPALKPWAIIRHPSGTLECLINGTSNLPARTSDACWPFNPALTTLFCSHIHKSCTAQASAEGRHWET